jgi:dUTP pyrophosphatase
MIVELIHPNAKLPTRATQGDAGLDVYTPEEFLIPARGHAKVSLGWRCEIPEGSVLLVFNKSGHAVRYGLNKGAEVIDSGYRGEVHIHLFNNTDTDVLFDAGDKIAQVLLMPVWTGQPVEGTVSDDTERGAGGFGSTGLR